ncbi:sugar kinase [Tabrizicola sp.]|uniref:sugar kinase n=1 Tax=Tabrizicola sp. TaxID=2005166 RepID=UPI003F36CF1F
MTKRFLSIGECMVEMAATGDGLFRQGFAGDTFNTAWHARHALGPDWTVSYFTTVGDDGVSERMLAFMRQEGIDISRIRQLDGRTPGLYLVELKDGERSFIYWRGTSAARALTDDEAALEAAVAEADAVYFSGITLAILAPEARVRLLTVLARAKARGTLVAFDSNIRPRLWPDEAAMRAAIRAAARVVTLALPTVPDETALFREADASTVAARYAADGVEEVVVRAGADAALVVWPAGRALVAPTATVVPVDTTGAGDSFNGTYIATRLSGDGPEAAAHKAHAIAARVIGAYGALV